MPEFGEFWKTKIRAHVRRLDTNQDGYLTRQDFEDMSDRYAQLDRQNAEKGRQMRVAFLTVCVSEAVISSYVFDF